MNRQEERKMTVTIAGKKKEIAEKTTIAQIIVSENVENPDYVTVTVNDEFVDSDAFATTELKDGDTVEFLYFMGGGIHKRTDGTLLTSHHPSGSWREGTEEIVKWQGADHRRRWTWSTSRYVPGSSRSWYDRYR